MKLADYLKAKSISLSEFATEIGVCTETVRRYTKGERFPSRFILNRILEATHGKVRPNDMLRDQEPVKAAE